MGRHKHKLGRWASGNLRLDILHELKVLAARNQITMAAMVNRALWLGLAELRTVSPLGVPMPDEINETPES